MALLSFPDSTRGDPDGEPDVESGATNAVHGIGALVAAWGHLAADLERKIGEIRSAFGDVRIIGGRTRPTMGRLLSELRAVVSQRDRRNNACLVEIADIEREVQRLDRFRQLVIEGFHHIEKGGVECRDLKNGAVHVPLSELELRIEELLTLRERLDRI